MLLRCPTPTSTAPCWRKSATRNDKQRSKGWRSGDGGSNHRRRNGRGRGDRGRSCAPWCAHDDRRTQEERLAEAAAQVRASGGEIDYRVADIAVPQECQRLVAATVERFGPVDVLVNNAAITAHGKPLHEWSVAEWDQVMATNVRAAFRAVSSRAARDARPQARLRRDGGFGLGHELLSQAAGCTASASTPRSISRDISARITGGTACGPSRCAPG